MIFYPGNNESAIPIYRRDGFALGDAHMAYGATHKAGGGEQGRAGKGGYTENPATYFSGTRGRKFDIRMGIMYLLFPKLRKGGIGIPDLIIAQNAIQHRLILFVLDKHFELMKKNPGLRMLEICCGSRKSPIYEDNRSTARLMKPERA